MSSIENRDFNQYLATIHYLTYGNIGTWSEEEMAQTLASIDAVIPALRLFSNRLRRQYMTAIQADAVVVEAQPQPNEVSDEEPDNEEDEDEDNVRAYRGEGEEDAYDYTIPESQLYGDEDYAMQDDAEEEDLVLPPNVQAYRGAYQQEDDDLMSLED